MPNPTRTRRRRRSASSKETRSTTVSRRREQGKTILRKLLRVPEETWVAIEKIADDVNAPANSVVCIALREYAVAKGKIEEGSKAT